jgi:hypothetical protein
VSKNTELISANPCPNQSTLSFGWFLEQKKKSFSVLICSFPLAAPYMLPMHKSDTTPEANESYWYHEAAFLNKHLQSHLKPACDTVFKEWVVLVSICRVP